MAGRATKAYSKLSGILFRQLQNKEPIAVRHWLDTETDKYYETFDRIVIPECSNIAKEVPGYSQRIKQFITHVNPSLDDCWNFGVELVYKKVAEKSHQTEENLTKMRILRAILELNFDMSAILDDCSDGSEMRRSKKTWHTICKGGFGAAIYDAGQMSLYPIHLLMKYFRDDPNYSRMLEVVSMGNLGLMIGQTIDVLGFDTKGSMDHYSHILKWKCGKFTSQSCGLGLLHAGISGDLVDESMSVCADIVCLFQPWDDFNDYYCTSEQTGKPSCDFINGATTWASCTAMANFTSSQAKEFKDCYGSNDSEKIARARKLYDDIDMPKLYVEYMIGKYNSIQKRIENLPHPKIREALTSWLEFYVGQDVSKRDLSY